MARRGASGVMLVATVVTVLVTAMAGLGSTKSVAASPASSVNFDDLLEQLNGSDISIKATTVGPSIALQNNVRLAFFDPSATTCFTCSKPTSSEEIIVDAYTSTANGFKVDYIPTNVQLIVTLVQIANNEAGPTKDNATFCFRHQARNPSVTLRCKSKTALEESTSSEWIHFVNIDLFRVGICAEGTALAKLCSITRHTAGAMRRTALEGNTEINVYFPDYPSLANFTNIVLPFVLTTTNNLEESWRLRRHPLLTDNLWEIQIPETTKANHLAVAVNTTVFLGVENEVERRSITLFLDVFALPF